MFCLHRGECEVGATWTRPFAISLPSDWRQFHCIRLRIPFFFLILIILSQHCLGKLCSIYTQHSNVHLHHVFKTFNKAIYCVSFALISSRSLLCIPHTTLTSRLHPSSLSSHHCEQNRPPASDKQEKIRQYSLSQYRRVQSDRPCTLNIPVSPPRASTSRLQLQLNTP